LFILSKNVFLTCCVTSGCNQIRDAEAGSGSG